MLITRHHAPKCMRLTTIIIIIIIHIPDSSPAFDSGGMHLYAIAAIDFSSMIADEMQFGFAFRDAERLVAVALATDAGNPFANQSSSSFAGDDDDGAYPSDESDETGESEGEESAQPPRTVVEKRGLRHRVALCPVSSGRLANLLPLTNRRMLYIRRPVDKGPDEDYDAAHDGDESLSLIPGGDCIVFTAGEGEVVVASNVKFAIVSKRGDHVLCVCNDKQIRVIDVSEEYIAGIDDGGIEEGEEDGFVNMDDRLIVEIDPAKEFLNIFLDVAGTAKDLFYGESRDELLFDMVLTSRKVAQ